MSEKQKQELLENKKYWRGKAYAFFRHTECESFPCHPTLEPENFNCLFCFCPLYALGESCGGNFTYTTSGLKDCSDCLIPHKKDNYGYIINRFNDIVEMMKCHKR